MSASRLGPSLPPLSYYLGTPKHIAVETEPALREVEASLKEDVPLEGARVVWRRNQTYKWVCLRCSLTYYIRETGHCDEIAIAVVRFTFPQFTLDETICGQPQSSLIINVIWYWFPNTSDLFLISSQNVFKISSKLCHAEFWSLGSKCFNFKCVKLLYPNYISNIQVQVKTVDGFTVRENVLRCLKM